MLNQDKKLNRFQQQQSQYYQLLQSVKKQTSKFRQSVDQDFQDIHHFDRSSILNQSQKIQTSKRRLTQLDTQIQQIQQKIQNQRKRIYGVNGINHSIQTQQKQHQKVQHLIQQTEFKYNKIIGQNKQTRLRIDSLRRQKLIFSKIYQQLKQEVANQQAEMSKIVNQGNQAINQRESMKNQIKALESAAQAQEQEFKQEFNHLRSFITRDKLLKQKNIRPAISKRKSLQMSTFQLSESQTEKKLMKQVAKAAWKLARDKALLLTQDEKVLEYDSALKKVQEQTGIASLEVFTKTFKETVEHNNQLKTYIKSLKKQIEEIEHNINLKVPQELPVVASAEQDMYRIKREKTKGFIRKYDLQSETINNSMNQISAGIDSLFESLGCQNKLSLETEEDLLLSKLKSIEYRAYEILEIYKESQNRIQVDSVKYGESKPLKLESDPPNIPEIAEEDEGSLPMTRAEMIKKAKLFMSGSRKIK